MNNREITVKHRGINPWMIVGWVVVLIMGAWLVGCIITMGAIGSVVTESAKSSTPAAPPAHLEPLTVEVLKVVNSPGGGILTLDTRMTNTSSRYLKHWSVRIELYGTGNEYLGSAIVIASELAPGASKIEEAIYTGIRADAVSVWKATLSGVVGQSGRRDDEHFQIAVK